MGGGRRERGWGRPEGSGGGGEGGGRRWWGGGGGGGCMRRTGCLRNYFCPSSVACLKYAVYKPDANGRFLSR